MARPSVENLDPERVSVPGAAKYLGYSESYTRQLADGGALPCTRTTNGTRIFLVRDLERFKFTKAVDKLVQRRA